MSNKERIVELFCQRMIENYENDPDPEKDKTFTLDECKKSGGWSDVSNIKAIEKPP